jgi:glutathione-regulated potassium-efflux system ancillary protein KefG
MLQRKILVLFAHPAFEKSRVNQHLARAARETAGVTFNDLYEEYPDFAIDVQREQKLLLEHDVIVWQHPFYWYSSPALLKEWQDLVLEHGFAYGSKGTALHGKIALNAITTGGPESSYQKTGYNRFTLRELLTPFEQTANLCGMTYLAPFVTPGTHRLDLEKDLPEFGKLYRRALEGLHDGSLDLQAAAGAPRLNEILRLAVRN